MSNRINLAHVLADLGPMYNSADIRTAAYRIGGDWYSLITVVRFSELSKDEYEKQSIEAWQQLRPIKHERLQIQQQVFAFDDRQQLFDEFKNGAVRFGELLVRLGRPVDILSESGYIQPPTFADPRSPWPTLQVQGNTSQWDLSQEIMQTIRSAGNSDDDLCRYLSTRAYSSLFEAIAGFLGLNRNNFTSCASEVYLWVPILADVRRACWNPEGSLTITYAAAPEVKAQFWLSAQISGTSGIGAEQRDLKLSDVKSGSTEWEMEAETESIADESARVDAALVHKSLGIINNHAWFVRDLIPRSKDNPLWLLFQKFCSAADLCRLLASPGTDSENRPQRLFELRVSWVLSAFGFISLPLGPQECLRDPGARVERGSLDIIAFHEQRRALILGSCKINAPRESDYDNLVNMRTLLLADLEGSDSFDTFMVIFTAAAEARLFKELETSGSGFFPRVIQVFDAQRLKAGIEALQNDETDWLFQQMTTAPVRYLNDC